MYDLRDFISSLHQQNELLTIDQIIDWKYEIGDKIKQVCSGSKKPPAILFKNIKEYPNFSIFTNGLATYSKIALALGLDHNTSFRNIIKILNKRMSNPIEPVIISSGPVQENVLLDDKLDLYNLPVPWWNRSDAGRYIGTWHLNVTKDPHNGKRNVGCYRMQLTGTNSIAFSVSPKSDIMTHIIENEKLDQSLEMAVVIGVQESLLMVAGAALPYGVDEYAIAGGLEEKAVELVKCKTINLEVPANSEIVIEGKTVKGKRVKEGPFLDYAGIPSVNPRAPLFEVSCIMYRNNPVFRGSMVGYPGAEDHILYSLIAQSDYFNFHGSNLRNKVQKLLLKRRLFKLFQLTGRVGKIIKS